jgi:hypothetical protein
LSKSPYEGQTPLTLANVAVGTRIVVIATRTGKEVGRFTICAPLARPGGNDSWWEVMVVPTIVPTCTPYIVNACTLGLVEADCEHSRHDPRATFLDP